MATITWSGLGGDANFSTPGNWLGDVAPGAGDFAVLAAGATVDAASQTVDSLASAAGDLLTVESGNSFTMTSGTGVGVNAGTIAIADNANLGVGGTVDNTGLVTLNSGGNTTRLMLNPGTVTLTGGGSVLLGDNINNQIRGQGGVGGVTLVNQDNTISGGGLIGIGEGSTALVNRGVIDAAAAANPLVIETGGGSTSTVNTGTLESTNTSVGDGGLQLNNTLIDNTGSGNAGQIIAAGTNTHVDIYSATIRGGTLSTSGGGVIEARDGGGVLDGSAANAPVNNTGSFLVPDNTAIQLLGTIVNSGTFTLASGGNTTRIYLNAGTVALTGGGQVVMGDNINNQIRGQGGIGGVTLLNQSNTISGGGSIGIGEGSTALINRAVIDATAAGNPLVIATGGGSTSTVNTGTLEATNTSVGNGGLQLNGTVIDNTGTGIAGSGNAGQIIAAGTNTHVDIYSATIKGGTLSTSGGGVIEARDGFGVLDGSAAGDPVNNTGNFLVPDNTAIQLLGTIVNSGTFTLASGGNTTRMYLNAGTVALTGGGQVVMDDNGGNEIRGQGGIGGVTLLNQDNTISGGGFIGIGEGSTGLINRSVIDADAVSNALVIDTGGGSTGTVNTGTLESTSQGGLQIDSTLVDNTGSNNAGKIIAAGANAHVDLYSATIRGGTLSTSGGGVIASHDRGVLLDGSTGAPVVDAGNLLVGDNSDIQLAGTLVDTGTLTVGSVGNLTRLMLNAGTVDITGGGTVQMTDNSANEIRGQGAIGGVTLLLNSNLAGAGYIGINEGSTGLINNALINATGVDNVLAIETDARGTTNNGTLEASSTSASGGLYIFNTTVQNAAGTIEAVAAGAQVLLQSADIVGGLLTTANGGVIRSLDRGVLLDGSAGSITNTGSLLISDNTDIDLAGTLNDTGSLVLGSVGNQTRLILTTATTTIAGSGTIVLSDDGANEVRGIGGGAQTLDLMQNLSGAGDIGVNDGSTGLINNALIDANSGDNLLFIQTDVAGTTNNGTLQASGNSAGGGLRIFNTTVRNSSGTIQAVTNGAQVQLQSVTVIGGLLTTKNGGVIRTLDRGVVLNGASGGITNAGSLVVTDNTDIDIAGTFDNSGAILVDSMGNLTRLVATSGTDDAPVTLTGGGSVTMTDNGSNQIIGTPGNGGTQLLINVNNTISGAGAIGANSGALAFTNAALVDATGANQLELLTGAADTVNTGTLESTNTGGLYIYATTVNNAGGSIMASGPAGSAVRLQSAAIEGGTIATAGGGVFTTLDRSVLIDGSASTVVDSATIDVSDNTDLDLAGTIANAGAINVNSGGNLTRLVADSPAVTLTGSGTVALNTAGVTQIIAGAAGDLLVNAGNTIEGTGQIGVNDGALGFANGGVVDANQASALVLGLGGTLTATNEAGGILRGSGAGGLVIQNSTLANAGTVEALNGSAVSMLSSAVLTNNSAGTLTSGTWRAVATTGAATLSLVGGGIVTDAATIVLSGAGSVLQAGDGSSFASLDSTLGSIAAGGTLQLLNGRNFTAAGALADAGVLSLGGVSFTASSVAIAANGTVSGSGTLAATVVDAGLIDVAAGAALKIAGAATGAGAQQIESGGTLELGAANAVNVAFAGTLDSLILDAPGSYTGTLSGLAPSDTIELAGVVATTATIAGGTLTVALSGGGSESYAITGGTDLREQVTVAGGNSFLTSYEKATASPHLPEPVTLAAQHVGGTLTQALTLTNTAPVSPFTENLDAAFGTPGSFVTAAGTIDLLAPGNTSTSDLAVGVNTTSDGVKTGTVPLNLFTDGTGVDGLGPLAITGQTVDVTGTVYALAAPGFAAVSLDLGAARVGDTAPAASVTITDGTTADAFQESLAYSAGSASAPFAVASGASGTIASGGSAALGVQLNTGTAGVFSAGSLSVALTSTGAGTSLLADTTLTPQGVALTGKVYAPAVAQPGTATIDFGTVHVGDTASTTLGIANTATGALTDLLTGGFGTVGAGFSGSGALGVAAGGSGTLTLTMATGSAGVQSGTASLALFSHDSDLSDIGVTAGPVTLQGVVNNYATADFAEAGGSGTLSGSGTSFTLDLGTLTLGSVVPAAMVAAANIAAGPADLLGGSFAIAGSSVFTNSGFVTFSAVAAGAEAAPGSIGVATTALGTFSETITLHSAGSNTSGYSGALADETLTVNAVVACFAAGTRVLTAQGEMNVEALREGDLVPTLQGARLARVVWVGHRRVDCVRHARPQEVWPVRVRAGAFAPGAPHTDLIVSPDHALYVNGVLIPVRALVNGASVVQEAAAEITYWHVELDRHDALLVHGLAAESYLDTGNRTSFANGATLRAHPMFARQAWDAHGCAPLMLSGPDVMDVRAKLHARASACAVGARMTA